jgi:hypothetical protein
MEDMAKYLVYWRKSPAWPTDPTESAKLTEMMWAGMDNMINAGQVKESASSLTQTQGIQLLSKTP